MSSKSTKTTTNTPYNKAAVDGANAGLAAAQQQSQATQAMFTPAIHAALGKISSNITNPQPYYTASRDQLAKTINGDYLNPASNPFSSGMADLIAKKTQGQYGSTFGASGRAHGGMAALLSSQGVGDALNSFYGGIYNQERGNQMQAIGMAPAFNADEYTGPNALINGVTGASMMPLNAANAYGAGITTVNEPYKTTTETSKQGFGIGQALGLAGMIGGAFVPGLGAVTGLGGGGSFGGMAGLLAKNAGSITPDAFSTMMGSRSYLG